MNLEIEYWMASLLEDLLKEKKMEHQKGTWQDHKGCSFECENRWCERFGQINLILIQIRKFRENVEKEFKGAANI